MIKLLCVIFLTILVKILMKFGENLWYKNSGADNFPCDQTSPPPLKNITYYVDDPLPVTIVRTVMSVSIISLGTEIL